MSDSEPEASFLSVYSTRSCDNSRLSEDGEVVAVPETPPSSSKSIETTGGNGGVSVQEELHIIHGHDDGPMRESNRNRSKNNSFGESPSSPPNIVVTPPSEASSMRSSGSSNSRSSGETTIPLSASDVALVDAQTKCTQEQIFKTDKIPSSSFAFIQTASNSAPMLNTPFRDPSKNTKGSGSSSVADTAYSNANAPKTNAKTLNPFIASTPVMSNNRKMMSTQKFSNLDVTNINFEQVMFGKDRSCSSEDEFQDNAAGLFNPTRGSGNASHTIRSQSSSSDDVRAVTSSEDDLSGGVHIVDDKFSDEDEVIVGAVGPVRQQDIDALTERMRQQTLESKKPLVKLLDQPPSLKPPVAKNYGNADAVPLLAGATEWMDDVKKLLKYLVTSSKEMPDPEADPTESDFEPPKRLRVELFPYQKYGVRWMAWRESNLPYGGILADEMGLGKTVMVMSVILKGLQNGDSQEGEKENWLTPVSRKLVPTNATLVVCPASCMKQWESELTTKAKGLRVYVYHGSKRTDSAAVLAQHHVVICPYSTITAEIPKPDDDPYNKCRSPLLRLYWSRIVLDEGHVIRNPKTGGALAICRIEAKRRWVVTGTPIHNKPEDFYSLVKFLRLSPFDDKACWKFWIGDKKLTADGVARLHLIGNSMTLRRVKAEINNCEIARLPPKTVEDVVLQLSEEERAVYDHLEEYARQQYKNYQEYRATNAELMQNAANNYVAGASRKKVAVKDPQAVNFSHMFVLLTRLRQMSVLPFLIQTMLGDEDASDDESYDAESDPINKNNPIFQIGYKSSKIRRVIQDVQEIQKSAAPGQPMDKIIIVSQWTTLLSIIGQHLTKRGFQVGSITGQDSFEERAAMMKKFNENPKRPQILLLSLMAGGVGLNLVGANYVFFLEPHWNPQLERQAQDRVHRHGQKKPVLIRRYICEETAESRVLELQGKKLELADGLLDSTKKMSTGAGLNMNDIKTLFGFESKAPRKQ